MFPYYIEDFHSNLADVVKFTGVAILVLGFSNFIWLVSSNSSSSPHSDKSSQGPTEHILRPTTCLHLLPNHLSRLVDLAR